MTFTTKLINLFPLSAGFFMLISFINLCRDPSLDTTMICLFWLYLYPLISYRIHNFLLPLQKGAYDLSKKEYNPWWGSFKIQEIYFHLPFLESCLQFIPGAYSLWLKLWGSNVGKGVVWTPNVEITDRGMMDIGNHVVFGHRSHFLCHVIHPKEARTLLIVERIKIEDEAFIGAGTRLGPGVTVDKGAILPALSIGLPRQNFKKEETKS